MDTNAQLNAGTRPGDLPDCDHVYIVPVRYALSSEAGSMFQATGFSYSFPKKPHLYLTSFASGIPDNYKELVLNDLLNRKGCPHGA